MTLDTRQLLLIVTGLAPIVGAIAILATSLFGGTRIGRIIETIACGLAVIAGSVLTALLLNDAENPEPVSLPVVDWLTLSGLQTFRISFGLTTTWVQSAVVNICGLLAWVAVQTSVLRAKNKPSSKPPIVLISLLYAAGTSYLFAPNISQALCGWLGVSYFAFLLFRSTSGSKNLGVDQLMPPLGSAPPNNNRHGVQLGAKIDLILAFGRDQIWVPVTQVLPQWIGEQWELIESETPSLQFLAASLGMAVVLFTWLSAP